MFYELLAGMNDWDKQELYLQGAETYYYLNQVRVTMVDANYFLMSEFPASIFSSIFLEGGSCELKGKQDKQDFQLLLQCFEVIGLQADQVSSVWAILSSILQLGNMCFSSYEVCVQSEGENRKIHNVNRPCYSVFSLRVSHLRWLVSLVRLKPGGLDACCRFLQRPCRQSSLIE